MTEPTDPWADRGFLRDVQYRTEANLAARQSIYAYQQPRVDLAGVVIDLAAPAAGETVCDVGCGNGAYLAELARRGFAGRVLGLDLSAGMLMAARERVRVAAAPAPAGNAAAVPVGGGASAAGQAAAPVGRIALVVGDAAALPLPDGAADLTLALHMLYHVPDPAQAVRELRRVTRPGGRVLIVLNGDDHLKELRAAVAEARGEQLWGQRERLRLDGGEALASSYFSTVTRHDFVSQLRLPKPGPIEDYVRSLSGAKHSADPDRVVATVLSAFPSAPDAGITITTHAGCLICEV